MKTKYCIVSYDRNTDKELERVPTTLEVFRAVKNILGYEFDPYGDCFRISSKIYPQLSEKTLLNLDLSKADYFIERCAGTSS